MNQRDREIVLPDDEARRRIARKSRRDFLIAGVACVGAVGAYEWIMKAKQEDGTPWPERRVLGLNRKISEGYLDDSHRMPTYSLDRVEPQKPNGDVGMTPGPDEGPWHLDVSTDAGSLANLTLKDVQSLPKVDMVTRFCCIEGWSTITHWTGARFRDFTERYYPAGQPFPEYIYMATPGEDYYVGLDMKSAMHPQTLLAYEMNGKPLAPEHGAPLRLAIPVKYGIKNIKRLGIIKYTKQKADDYWSEQGYDWFAGL